METTDDFDLLGRAVARVLREAFTTAGEAREGTTAASVEAGLAQVLADVRALPARVREERAAEAARFTAELTAARTEVESALADARAAADAIRAQAVTDARAIVDGATAEVARARDLVAEERVRLDSELKTLVRDVRHAVSKLESAAVGDHSEMLDRATTEARMILRQARLHHRSTAKEVDRMIEAAAAEAASLRKTALADAARIAARVRGVVDVPSPAPTPTSEAPIDDDLPMRNWVRPSVAAEPSADEGDAALVEHPKRRGRRLAS